MKMRIREFATRAGEPQRFTELLAVVTAEHERKRAPTKRTTRLQRHRGGVGEVVGVGEGEVPGRHTTLGCQLGGPTP